MFEIIIVISILVTGFKNKVITNPVRCLFKKNKKTKTTLYPESFWPIFTSKPASGASDCHLISTELIHSAGDRNVNLHIRHSVGKNEGKKITS